MVNSPSWTPGGVAAAGQQPWDQPQQQQQPLPWANAVAPAGPGAVPPPNADYNPVMQTLMAQNQALYGTPYGHGEQSLPSNPSGAIAKLINITGYNSDTHAQMPPGKLAPDVAERLETLGLGRYPTAAPQADVGNEQTDAMMNTGSANRWGGGKG